MLKTGWWWGQGVLIGATANQATLSASGVEYVSNQQQHKPAADHRYECYNAECCTSGKVAWCSALWDRLQTCAPHHASQGKNPQSYPQNKTSARRAIHSYLLWFKLPFWGLLKDLEKCDASEMLSSAHVSLCGFWYHVLRAEDHARVSLCVKVAIMGCEMKITRRELNKAVLKSLSSAAVMSRVGPHCMTPTWHCLGIWRYLKPGIPEMWIKSPGWRWKQSMLDIAYSYSAARRGYIPGRLLDKLDFTQNYRKSWNDQLPESLAYPLSPPQIFYSDLLRRVSPWLSKKNVASSQQMKSCCRETFTF